MSTRAINHRESGKYQSHMEMGSETGPRDASELPSRGRLGWPRVSQRPARLTASQWHWLSVAGCLAVMLSAARVLAESSLLPSAPSQGTNPSPLLSLPAAPAQAAGYSLVFSTDFNPLNLSPDGRGSYTWYNPGIWWERPAPSGNIFVSNSALELVRTPDQKNPDTSISTAAPDGSYYLGWHYGYFEVRMRWDTVIDAWPAIWMMPIQGIKNAHHGVETGELDIFEGSGSTPDVFYGSIHDWLNGQDVANNSCCSASQLPGGIDLSQYHTYGLLWTPGRVTWYLDDQPLNSFATFPIFDDCTQKYYLILGSQVSGVTASSIGMQVEWVRVWQSEAAACPPK